MTMRIQGLLALTAAAVAGAPATADDLYIGGPDGVVMHADPADGVFQFAGVCAGPINSMAYHDGDILAGDRFGTVYRIDLATRVPVDAFNVGLDATDMEMFRGDLFVSGSDGHVVRVDLAQRAVADTYYAGDNLQAMAIGGNQIYAGGPSTIIYRSPVGLDAFEAFSACGGQVNSATIDNADLLYADTNGTIYRFDSLTGVYTSTIATSTDGSALVMHGGDVLIADSSGRVLRVDAHTGAVKAEFDAGIRISAMVLVRDACIGDFLELMKSFEVTPTLLATHARPVLEAFEAEGADAWYSSPPARFLGNDYDPDDFEQVTDIIEAHDDLLAAPSAVAAQRVFVQEQGFAEMARSPFVLLHRSRSCRS